MKAYFVVGTDTEVGKTTVTAALVRAACARGLAGVGFKPAESGCETVDGRLVAADAAALVQAAGGRYRLEEICCYRFQPAVAPGVAADQLGVTIDFEVIRAAIERIRERRPDLLLIEGAGGLLVPFGGGRLLADLVVALGVPALVVGRAGLGTINHTLLAVEALRARDVEVAGVVLVATEPIEPAFAASNQAEIERAGQVRVAGTAPHTADPAQLDAWVDRHLLDRLL